MKKTLTKLFILFSLLLTVTTNATPFTLDSPDTTDIEIYSNYPLDSDKIG